MPVLDKIKDGFERILPSGGGGKHSIPPLSSTGISSLGNGGIGHARFEDDVRIDNRFGPQFSFTHRCAGHDACQNVT